MYTENALKGTSFKRTPPSNVPSPLPPSQGPKIKQVQLVLIRVLVALVTDIIHVLKNLNLTWTFTKIGS